MERKCLRACQNERLQGCQEIFEVRFFFRGRILNVEERGLAICNQLGYVHVQSGFPHAPIPSKVRKNELADFHLTIS
jgi:hypothetical protein